MDVGERLFLYCDGGPAIGRAVTYPPPGEIDVVGGTYVLVDDGSPEQWRYHFLPSAP